jgi:lycopene elongase/hydratase (dihydrobisanhydrobacterioruberin-forming)
VQHRKIIAIFAAYFLISANIWIYGINDIYDYETDKLNPKKTEGYEALVTPPEQKSLWKRILWTTLPFLISLPWPIP